MQNHLTAQEKYQNIWKQASSRKKVILFLIAYTLIFLFTFFLAYTPFLLNGHSFIWYEDGRHQHYPALIYTGQYIRSLLSSFFHGNFDIPLIDFNIAGGSDIFSTLNYYGFGDPLNLISAFVPVRYTEYLYNFLLIFRIYLSGLTFSLLCRYHKKRICYTLIGCIIYTFSGYVAFYAVRHPFFLNPMIQLPLLLIGVDLILRKRKPFIFIFSVFYSALCGFYFLYMMTIFVGLYVLVKFFEYYTSKRLRQFFFIAKQIFLYYLLGIGLSAILFLPSVYGFLSSGRFGEAIQQNLFSYSIEYYGNYLFLGAIAPPAGNENLSLAVIALLAAVSLFVFRKKEQRSLKILLSISIIIYLLPLGGYIMSGFSYASQRWCFGLVLLISYITVDMLPFLLSMTRRQSLLCLVIFLIYILNIVFLKVLVIYCNIGFIMLLFTFFLLMPHINTVPKNEGSSANKLSRFPRSKFIACFFLVIINVAVNTFITFSENTTDYISEYAEYGYETDYVYNSLEHDAAQHSQTATWRYDSTSFGNNLGTVWQIPTTSVFWSMLNRHIVDFNMQLENCNQRFSSDILGTDNRTALTAILSTKYYIDKPQKNPCIPYGYDFPQETADGNCIYENKYSLPLGYTYNTWFPYEKLHGLNGLQKQEAMLQAIALDKNPVTSLEGKLKSSIQDISYQISAMHNIEWKNGILDVKQENASITLNYQFPTAAERYLRLEGFNINNSGYNEFYISVDSSDFHKNTRIASDVSYYYYGCENYLFNLGYGSQKQGSCIITFPRIGKFRLTDIKLFAQPMDEYPIQVQTLRKEPLENITLETNRITGTIDLSGNKILCMSIPYSHGWTAKVDGQPVEILRGNIMFMALPLSAGHHELEFLYCTPGLKFGALCSIISLLILLIMLQHKKKNLGDNNNDNEK